MNSKIKNIRTKVDKRQIVQYLLLRQRILHDKVLHPTNDSKESIAGCNIRFKEITTLIAAISQDTIDKKIRLMHQYIHRQNDYVKELKHSHKTSSTHRKNDDQYFNKLDKACSALNEEANK